MGGNNKIRPKVKMGKKCLMQCINYPDLTTATSASKRKEAYGWKDDCGCCYFNLHDYKNFMPITF